MAYFEWTDEAVEKLRSLWPTGLSCFQIALQLGPGCTKNAVIGKSHRLGLPAHGDKPRLRSVRPSAPVAGHATRPASQRRHKPRKWPRKPFPGEPAPIAAAPPPPRPRSSRKLPVKPTLLELVEDSCRWPIGDPGTPDFHFCGQQREIKAYCLEHAQRAFQRRIST